MTVSNEATIPVIGGVAVGGGVFEGVGVIGVSEGVRVNVGSGVREGTGVAVKRGVMLTMTARVLVGTIACSCVWSGDVQLVRINNPAQVAPTILCTVVAKCITRIIQPT